MQRVPAREERRDRIAFADAFRAIAILSVVANHVAVQTRLAVLGMSDDLAYLGAWGVDGFFVLSGYLLGRQYLDAILDDREAPATRAFLARRFFRIYPAYAFAVIVCAIGSTNWGHTPFPFAAVATHLTFVNGFVPQQEFSLDEPLWTMAVDAQFYVLLPLVAYALARLARRFPRSRRAAVCAFALVAIVVASLAYRWIVCSVFHLRVVGDDVATTFVLARNVVGMAPAFALGGLVALLPRFGFLGDGSDRAPHPALSVVVGGTLLVLLAWCGRTIVGTSAYGIVYDAIGALSAACLFDGFSRGAFRLARVLPGSTIVARIAALAYGVYLFHVPVLHAVMGAIGAVARLPDGSAVLVSCVAAGTLAVSFAVAEVTSRFVERPGLALRDRFGSCAALVERQAA